MKAVLATDCGSTTSKARFFKKIGDKWRFIASGEAPTTVETPYEDVTLGVLNAVREVEELTGHKLLSNNRILTSSRHDSEGVALYITTSSAGGGLQMMVAGLVRILTAESAERAALGAGAIVMDVLSYDDGRETYEKIERIRFLRPDMILFAGGTDGGNILQVLELAECLVSAKPNPRFGASYKLPVIYAGNKYIANRVEKMFSETFATEVIPNIRPTLNEENIQPSREAVHQLFMEHVMAHAPGYTKLMTWTPVPIMPTPAGEPIMLGILAEEYKENVIGVGLGGATTNVYSSYDGKFVRTVSANLGMSYSICNVLKTAGILNIKRWLPFQMDETELVNILSNKMIRPTGIPQTLRELIVEHAVAREALRMGFEHHKSLARPLLGGKSEHGVRLFSDEDRTSTYITLSNVQWLAGTGGLLSHAPRRVQSALLLIDGFGVEGITKLVQDSVFMMPHLGIFSTVHRKAALQIFEEDCLVRIGTCVTIVGQEEVEFSTKVAHITMKMPDGRIIDEDCYYGKIKKYPLGKGESAELEITPIKGFDVGIGLGNKVSEEVEGGDVGILVDARGRPPKLPENDEKRRKRLLDWFTALDAYPKEFLDSLK